MSPTAIEVRRRLPYRAEDLVALVSDVRAYPRFIPWVKSLSLKLDRQGADGSWSGVAEALVGWRAFTERFATRVTCAPGEHAVDVALVSGPFRILENRWRFTPIEHDGCEMRFFIRYQFKNPILQALAAANRDLAANRIMAAFLDEAARRYPARGNEPLSDQTV